MVSDWIKMRTDLYRDPKVCMMADSLLCDDGDLARYVNQICQRDMTVTRNVTRNAVVGALVTVWGTVRHRGKRVGDDLVCAGAILAVIDDIADIPGFGEAMQDVGWVEDTSEGIVFPRFFAEFNNQPETSSALSPAERQRKYRERKRNVTVTSPVTSPVTSRNDREEKRREEDLELHTHREREEESDGLPGNEEPGQRAATSSKSQAQQGQGEAGDARDESSHHSAHQNASQTNLNAFSEIPSKREWMDACGMGGVPTAFAEEVWAKYDGDNAFWTRRAWRLQVQMVKGWMDKDVATGKRNHDGTLKVKANGGFTNPRHAAREAVAAIDYKNMTGF